MHNVQLLEIFLLNLPIVVEPVQSSIYTINIVEIKVFTELRA